MALRSSYSYVHNELGTMFRQFKDLILTSWNKFKQKQQKNKHMYIDGLNKSHYFGDIKPSFFLIKWQVLLEKLRYYIKYGIRFSYIW